jgi:hypothetical protein
VLVDAGCVDTDSTPADFNNGAKLGFLLVVNVEVNNFN